MESLKQVYCQSKYKFIIIHKHEPSESLILASYIEGSAGNCRVVQTLSQKKMVEFSFHS